MFLFDWLEESSACAYRMFVWYLQHVLSNSGGLPLKIFRIVS